MFSVCSALEWVTMAQGHSPGVSAAHGPPWSEEAVREALIRVLASHEFRTSKRSQDFLRWGGTEPRDLLAAGEIQQMETPILANSYSEKFFPEECGG